MALLESWESEVSRREAVTEVMLHNIPLEEFYSHCGFQSQYIGGDVLTFLGY